MSRRKENKQPQPSRHLREIIKSIFNVALHFKRGNRRYFASKTDLYLFFGSSFKSDLSHWNTGNTSRSGYMAKVNFTRKLRLIIIGDYFEENEFFSQEIFDELHQYLTCELGERIEYIDELLAQHIKKLESARTRDCANNTRESIDLPNQSRKETDRARNESLKAGHSKETKELLEKYRALSEVTRLDADNVGTDTDGRRIFLHENVYVEREIESEVYKRICSSPKEHILVVGEAGYGKTSLLWSLYGALSNRLKKSSFFIKSGLLFSEGNTVRVDLVELMTSLMETGAEPILLIDTIDIILHDPLHRDHFLAFLQNLKSRGICVVVSCRPNEANLIPDTCHRFDLSSYNEIELPIAIANYSHRLHHGFDTDQKERQIANLNEAVAQGYPVGDLCANPLTLRMLFLLYAPLEIPPEINITRLYKDYWCRRVKKDVRAGQDHQMEQGDDFSRDAMVFALILLAEGTPEISVDVVRAYCTDKAMLDIGLLRLTQRGVLNRTEYSSSTFYSFFHQTFFEHTAARAVVFFRHESGLQLLADKLQERPADLFVAAVLEQALLLCEDQPRKTRDLAAEITNGAITHKSAALKQVSAYVFIHRSRPGHDLFEKILESVKINDPIIIDRILSLGANTPGSRLDELMGVLLAIMRDSTADQLKRTLLLLKRFAEMNPNSIVVNLKALCIEEKILGDPQKYVASVIPFIDLAAQLSSCDNAWAWLVMRNFYGLFTTRFGSVGTQAAIVNIMVKYGQRLGSSDIFDRFQNMIDHGQIKRKKSGEDLTLPLASLQLIQWKSQGITKTDLTDIPSREERMWLHARLNAIAKAILEIFPEHIEDLAIELALIEDRYVSSLWIRIGILELLRFAIKSPDRASSDAVYLATRKLYRKLHYEEDRDKIKILLDTIDQAGLPSNICLMFPEKQETESEEFWSDIGVSGPLLFKALRSNIPAAKKGLRILLKDPPDSDGARLYVVSQLANLALEAPEWTSTYLQQAQRFRFVESINKFIDMGSSETHNALLQQKEELDSFRRRWMDLGGGGGRRELLRLWVLMVKRELSPLPAWNWLIEYADGKKEPAYLPHIFALISTGAVRGEYNSSEAMRALRGLSVGKSNEIIDSAAGAAADIAGALPIVEAPILDILLEISFRGVVSGARVGKQAGVLKRLAEQDIETSIEFLEKFLDGVMAATKQGPEVYRTIHNRWAASIGHLLAKCDSEQACRIAALIPKLHEFLAQLVSECICRVKMEELSDIIDDLMINPDVHYRVKRMISFYKYKKERTQGSDVWPEIAGIIRLIEMGD